MKQFPKMRPSVWDALVVVAVLLLAAGSGAAIWGGNDRTAGELQVVISVDGKEVERCLLAEFPDAEQVYSNNGYTLRVALAGEDPLGIVVKSSDCPTQDCVHTGAISRTGQSIVCLPARVIVQLEGGGGDSSVDLVVG